MKNLLTRRSSPGRAGTLKAWVAQHLVLSEDDLVTVAELACYEPGCPPVETVVTVHGADGMRRIWHIHKPLADIDQSDIATVFMEIMR